MRLDYVAVILIFIFLFYSYGRTSSKTHNTSAKQEIISVSISFIILSALLLVYLGIFFLPINIIQTLLFTSCTIGYHKAPDISLNFPLYLNLLTIIGGIVIGWLTARLSKNMSMLNGAVGTKLTSDVLLSLPFLTLGAAIIITQHNAIIGALASYCATELQSFLDERVKANCPPQWENSLALQSYHKSSTRLRTWGHSILLLVPALAALGSTIMYSGIPFSLHGILWWIGLICIVTSVWLLRWGHLARTRFYRNRSWRDSGEIGPSPRSSKRK